MFLLLFNQHLIEHKVRSIRAFKIASSVFYARKTLSQLSTPFPREKCFSMEGSVWTMSRRLEFGPQKRLHTSQLQSKPSDLAGNPRSGKQSQIFKACFSFFRLLLFWNRPSLQVSQECVMKAYGVFVNVPCGCQEALVSSRTL